MAVTRHQPVDISSVAGPVRREHFAAAAGRPLVPQVDIVAGNRVDIGHVALLGWLVGPGHRQLVCAGQETRAGMSLTIAATKISGIGLATTAVAKQYDHLVGEFPDIRDVHRWGTLNLQLEYPLRILNPDYTTSAIEWDPGFKEQFSL